jgi:hypothetical protein
MSFQLPELWVDPEAPSNGWDNLGVQDDGYGDEGCWMLTMCAPDYPGWVDVQLLAKPDGDGLWRDARLFLQRDIREEDGMVRTDYACDGEDSIADEEAVDLLAHGDERLDEAEAVGE